ncbi:MAG: nuclear transport factor 2 family protein [Hyphomicrobiaceae bacterium]
MRMSRREIAMIGSAALVLPSFATAALAEGGDEAAVKAAVEALRVAIIKADKARLEELAHDKLAYCHSSGRLETKAQYVAAYTSGKNTYKKLEFGDLNTIVAGDNAITRHTFAAQIARSTGKVDDIKIGVTEVWVKQNGAWKLFARQGYKLPS